MEGLRTLLSLNLLNGMVMQFGTDRLPPRGSFSLWLRVLPIPFRSGSLHTLIYRLNLFLFRWFRCILLLFNWKLPLYSHRLRRSCLRGLRHVPVINVIVLGDDGLLSLLFCCGRWFWLFDGVGSGWFNCCWRGNGLGRESLDEHLLLRLIELRFEWVAHLKVTAYKRV